MGNLGPNLITGLSELKTYVFLVFYSVLACRPGLPDVQRTLCTVRPAFLDVQRAFCTVRPIFHCS